MYYDLDVALATANMRRCDGCAQLPQLSKMETDLQVEWRGWGQLVRLAGQSCAIMRRRAGLRATRQSLGVPVGTAVLD